MNRESIFKRSDLEKWAEILGVSGDLAGLTDSQLLDRISAALLERKEALRRSEPGGQAIPRFEGGGR